MRVLRQGTTPEFVFELPFDTDRVKTAKVTFVTNNGTKVEKRHEDCSLEGNKITVKLSQEDTFRLEVGPIRVQLRILTQNEEALSSDTFSVNISKCLDDEVLT